MNFADLRTMPQLETTRSSDWAGHSVFYRLAANRAQSPRLNRLDSAAKHVTKICSLVEKHMSQRQRALKSPCGLSLLSIGLLLFVTVVTSEGATLSRLRVGYPSPSASFFPLFATKEAGLFEKYGFDTEMVYVQGVQLVQVHVAGQLDFSTISSVVIFRRPSRAPI